MKLRYFIPRAKMSPAKVASATTQRGTSLIELVIASSLMLLLLGAAYSAVSAGLRYQRRSEGLLDLEQSAVQTLAALGRELAEAHFPATTVDGPGNSALLFTSCRDANAALIYDATGRLLWDSAVCIRLEDFSGKKRLIRQEEFIGGNHIVPVSPENFSPARDFASFAASSLPIRVIARDISAFTVEKLSTGGADQIRFRLEFLVQADNHSYGLNLTSNVTPRN